MATTILRNESNFSKHRTQWYLPSFNTIWATNMKTQKVRNNYPKCSTPNTNSTANTLSQSCSPPRMSRLIEVPYPLSMRSQANRWPTRTIQMWLNSKGQIIISSSTNRQNDVTIEEKVKKGLTSFDIRAIYAATQAYTLEWEATQNGKGQGSFVPW